MCQKASILFGLGGRETEYKEWKQKGKESSQKTFLLLLAAMQQMRPRGYPAKVKALQRVQTECRRNRCWCSVHSNNGFFSVFLCFGLSAQYISRAAAQLAM